jgi:hypothetical protein
VARARARWVLLGGLALVAAALAVTIGRTDQRRAAATDVQAQIEVARIVPGARACQADERLSDVTGAVRVSGWVEGGGARLRVSVDGRQGGPPLAVAPPPAELMLPLAAGVARDAASDLCIHNEGPGTVVLAGSQTGPEHQLVVVGRDGRRVRGAGRARIEALVDEQPVSLWSLVGELPDRIATATGSVLAPWLALGGLLVAVATSVALLWRAEDEERRHDA